MRRVTEVANPKRQRVTDIYIDFLACTNHVVSGRGVLIPAGLVVGREKKPDAWRFQRIEKEVCYATHPFRDAFN